MSIKKSSYLFVPIIILSLMSYCSSSLEYRTKKRVFTGIERTLGILNSGTAGSPNNLEILFYGQSIIEGMKTNILIDSLKKRFPNTNINFKHKPIGGFTIPDLIKTAPHDVYQENPDLIIFHAYDGIKDGLFDSLIKNIRMRTPADILLLDHHLVWNKPQSKLKSINKSHDFDSEAIKNIAKKYDCGFVNVREQWKSYLENNNISPNELIGNTIDPNVHPNDKGNLLLRQIILSKFPKTAAAKGFDIKNDSLRAVVPFNNAKKQFKTKFSGAIVELFTDRDINSESTIEVFIDGKKPSEFRSSYHIERPSKGYETSWPGLSHVSFGKTLPQEENWVIKVYDIDRTNKEFKYSLTGSVTGFDGVGSSQGLFKSNSNRINIDGSDFNIFRIERIFQTETPENFEINFEVNQIARDTVHIKPNKNKYLLFKSYNLPNNSIKELQINVIKGDSNFEHLLISKPFISK